MLAAGGVLVALALPALGLHTALPGATDLRVGLPVLQTYNRIQEAFPGGPTPALVVVEASNVGAPVVRDGIAALQQRALATGEMTEPTYVRVNPNGTMAMVAFPLVGNGENAASAHALSVLRTEVIPTTIGKVAGTRVNVTGMTAGSRDFNSALKQRAPLVFGFVLALAFVLLLVAFRSLVIAAKTTVLNLMSVAAAYGVLVLVFQHGWGTSLLDYPGTNSIAAWLPLFLFVLLFGLSMDYHVFILSRVREAHEQGRTTEEAVEQGITMTAGVVTAAAIVMVCVFLTFATLEQISFKQMGIGLAAAVLIDATIVRGVLLPATMKLLGDWNWYLPRWLWWLPEMLAEAPASALMPEPETPVEDDKPTGRSELHRRTESTAGRP